jgi:hypothetical protein
MNIHQMLDLFEKLTKVLELVPVLKPYAPTIALGTLSIYLVARQRIRDKRPELEIEQTTTFTVTVTKVTKVTKIIISERKRA